MKIAVSSTGNNLDSPVDPRFGRCPGFIIVDPETLEFEKVPNTGAEASEGAGIATAQDMLKKGVKAVLTGHCGPNAHRVLTAAGVEVITGASGSVREAARKYLEGNFLPATAPDVTGHYGSRYGQQMQQGYGRGRRSLKQ